MYICISFTACSLTNSQMNMKKFFQYTIFAFLGVGLLYYMYHEIPLQELIEIGRRVKFQWVGLAIISHLINHWIRSMRWQLLIESQGYSISTVHAFMAEMSGFMMNLVPPRIGEWMRCVVLKRLEGVPISKSLGAALVERFIEICIFILLLMIGILIKLNTGESVLPELSGIGNSMLAYRPSSEISALLAIVILCGLFVLIRYTSFFVAGLKKARDFLKEVGRAIKDTRKSNGWRLWIMSILTLVFHFSVEYLSFFAIEEINIGLREVLFVFLSMSIGMALPTPGGIGGYHVIVTTTLVSLGVELKYAIVYAILTHFIQLFNALFVGGGCLLLSTFYKTKFKQKS